MENQDELLEEGGGEPMLVADLSTPDLRIILRQHVLVVIAAVIVVMVAYVLPSETWWWWLIKGLMFFPALFIGTVRYFMLNGAKAEIDRRNKVSSGDEEDIDKTERLP